MKLLGLGLKKFKTVQRSSRAPDPIAHLSLWYAGASITGLLNRWRDRVSPNYARRLQRDTTVRAELAEPRSGVSLSPSGRGKRAERSRERGVKVSPVRRKGEVFVSLAAPLPVAYATTLSPPGR
ncbi:MAG TPA: hypothetical protein VNM92_14285, partial [Thermoanaerobaculia bacterium]|nr:hypothetical protein [Thermoanaerobaculia bacterium]